MERIEVNDKLPEMETWALVACKPTSGWPLGMEIAYLTFNEWHTTMYHTVGDVTSWRPLPNPPKDFNKI